MALMVSIIITPDHVITMPMENMQEFPINVKKILIIDFFTYLLSRLK